MPALTEGTEIRPRISSSICRLESRATIHGKQLSFALGNTSAVLFDMDGTLCNSIPFHFEATNQAMQHFGGQPLTWEVFVEECIRQGKKARDLLRLQNLHATPQQWNQIKDRCFRQSASRCLSLAPGVFFLLESLRQASIPVGIVTTARRRSLETFLSRCWPGPRPAVIVTYDDVHKGKPDAEPYRLACRRLRCKRRHCLAFEDSQAGITSARNAGIYCAAIATPLFTAQELDQADALVGSFEDVICCPVRGEYANSTGSA